MYCVAALSLNFCISYDKHIYIYISRFPGPRAIHIGSKRAWFYQEAKTRKEMVYSTLVLGSVL